MLKNFQIMCNDCRSYLVQVRQMNDGMQRREYSDTKMAPTPDYLALFCQNCKATERLEA